MRVSGPQCGYSVSGPQCGYSGIRSQMRVFGYPVPNAGIRSQMRVLDLPDAGTGPPRCGYWTSPGGVLVLPGGVLVLPRWCTGPPRWCIWLSWWCIWLSRWCIWLSWWCIWLSWLYRARVPGCTGLGAWLYRARLGWDPGHAVYGSGGGYVVCRWVYARGYIDPCTPVTYSTHSSHRTTPRPASKGVFVEIERWMSVYHSVVGSHHPLMTPPVDDTPDARMSEPGSTLLLPPVYARIYAQLSSGTSNRASRHPNIGTSEHRDILTSGHRKSDTGTRNDSPGQNAQNHI